MLLKAFRPGVVTLRVIPSAGQYSVSDTAEFCGALIDGS